METDLVSVKDLTTVKLNGPIQITPKRVDGNLEEILLSDGIELVVIRRNSSWNSWIEVLQPREQAEPPCDNLKA